MLETLNDECFCLSLDRDALRKAVEADSAAAGLHRLIAERCPHVFAALPVFLARRHVDAMAAVIQAVEQVAAMPAYLDAALGRAPPIARHDPRTPGVFMGYDFHVGDPGPKLIEINTNAGGAMLNALLARAQRACCAEVGALVGGPIPAAELERRFVEMFAAEWRAAGRSGLPRRIAIVDEAPEAQYLFPEFLLFAQLFRRYGVPAVIRSPAHLVFADGLLRDNDGPIDFVYNRLTDFYLQTAGNAALREAYLSGAAVLSPHPRAHALYAVKSNLALLTDPVRLRSWGVDQATVDTLQRGIARTAVVRPDEAEPLWAARRQLFFKPVAGHGGKAAYRGDKLTRRVWGEILAGNYVAQELVAPGERRTGRHARLKVDIRNYVYAGEVQLLAARLYQGQTTNFRTTGGGFAPVLSTPRELSASAAGRTPATLPQASD